MPINKSARFRFEILDECLRNDKKKWSKNDLLSFVNRRLQLHLGNDHEISLSQLRYDIEAMQSDYSAPIEMYREGRSYFYRYEHPDFSLKTIPLEAEDLIKLNTAVNLLQQIKGFNIADEIATIVSKLENRYKFPNPTQQTIISFDSSPATQGIEHLEDIYHAIIRKNVLKITYQSFQKKATQLCTISPYILKEYNNRWYLLGHCLEKDAISTYALDRIKDIRVANLSFAENTTFDADKYFANIIGITKPANKKTEQIDLMFTPELAPYILTKPIHQSQQIIEQLEGGILHIRLHLIINPELVSLILSFGKDVRIIYPEHLSFEIQQAAKVLLDHYE